MSYAKVQVSGFIRRLEMKYTPAGMAICEFSIPIDKKWTDKNTGEKREKTSWVNLKAFGKIGENIEKYFPVGSGITIFGDIEVEEWESDGGKRSKTVVNVQSFDFPPVARSEGGQNSAPQQRASAPPPANKPSADFDDFDDDVIF